MYISCIVVFCRIMAKLLPACRAVLFWLLSWVAATAHAQTLHIGSWDRKGDTLTKVGEAVLSQAYAELQQPVEFADLPIRRAMSMMLHGDLDGNVFRIAALADEQPSLFRVDPPIVLIEVRAYALKAAFKASNWSQLSKLRVVYQRGALIVERNLPDDTVRIEAASTAEVFRVMGRGMADVALVVEQVQSEPHPQAIATGLVRLEGAMERTALHHYLLGSHREFGARLGAVLKRMSTSGDMQAITQKVLQSAD